MELFGALNPGDLCFEFGGFQPQLRVISASNSGYLTLELMLFESQIRVIWSPLQIHVI
jgi:hypothetical protein